MVANGLPLARAGASRNLIFLPLLAVLWMANCLVHAELLGPAPGLARKGIFLGVNLIVLLIVIMGGRVIPFFTERALPGVAMKRWPIIEWLPFRFIIDVPVQIMTGAVTVEEGAQLLLGQWTWVGVFLAVTLLLWKSGLKRFGAYGG